MAPNPYESPHCAVDIPNSRSALSWIRIGLASLSGLIILLHVLGAIGWFHWILVREGDLLEGWVYGSLSIIGSLGFLAITLGIVRRQGVFIRAGLVIVGVQFATFLMLISIGPEAFDRLLR